jgi:hypothetical protein
MEGAPARPGARLGALIHRTGLRSGPNGGKYMIFRSLRKSFGG